VREVEKALGTGEKVMTPVEAELRGFARRSIFAIRDIRDGETFTAGNIGVLRCGNLRGSLEPRLFQDLLGKRARRNISAETAIQKEDYV
jgi:sialic acid synthase SpsE